MSEGLLQEAAEKDLYSAIKTCVDAAGKAIAEEDFANAMSRLAELRVPADAFFEQVLVNDEDQTIRANRLALLNTIRAATSTVADFSKISG